MRAAYRAAQSRRRATSSGRLRRRKASDGRAFVLKHLKDGVQFGDLQQIVHTPGEVEQFHVASGVGDGRVRSEEHTSELQSQSNLVCRLLLEKKKKQKIPYISKNKIK